MGRGSLTRHARCHDAAAVSGNRRGLDFHHDVRVEEPDDAQQRPRGRASTGILEALRDFTGRREKRWHVGRVVIEAHDVAQAALWLASDDAAMINGVILPVDGGITASGYRGPTPQAVGAAATVER